MKWLVISEYWLEALYGLGAFVAGWLTLHFKRRQNDKRNGRRPPPAD